MARRCRNERAYCAQKVAISTTGHFAGEEVVVYDTGLAYGGVESASTQAISEDPPQH